MKTSYIEGDKKRKPLYLTTAQERAPYQIKVENGLILNPMTGLPDSWKGLFVMDEQGLLYAMTEAEYANVCHSTFFAGGRVAAAGTLRVKDGILQYIDTGSGHYGLPDETLKGVLASLVSSGADIQFARVAFGGTKKSPTPERLGGNALEYLLESPWMKLCLNLIHVAFPKIPDRCEWALKLK
jgi:hypothetical protein